MSIPRIIRFLFSVSLLIGVVWSLYACSSPESRRRDFFEGAVSTVQWPPSPQNPRILYAGSIREPRMSGERDSWARRFLRGVFGTDGDSPVLLRPYGIFADGERIYVTDPGSAVLHVFDRTQNRYMVMERAGDDDFVSPIGIAADAQGDMYVSDSVLRKVFVFNREGRYRRSIGSSEIFRRPAGIAIREDKIYIVDTHGHKVFVFSLADGRMLFTFGRQGADPGTFNYPTNIFAARDGLIYVMDSMNFRVQIFKFDGSFVSAFGKAGDGSGSFSKPKGIAVDSEGHIYVADSHFDNIQVFDSGGKLLLIVGNAGNAAGEFALPSGMYIDSLDRIYVADSLNRRVQILQYVKGASNTVAK